MLVVHRAALRIGQEPGAIELAVLEPRDELRGAQPPVHQLADDRRDDGVVERVVLVVGVRLVLDDVKAPAGIFSIACRRLAIAPAVRPSSKIADGGQTAAHVAYASRIERDLGFVPAGDQKGTRIAGLRHHQQAADSGLKIFAREVADDWMRVLLENGEYLVVDALNRDDPVADTVRRSETFRNRTSRFRVVSRRHVEGGDVLGAERVHRQCQGQGRVDAARDSDRRPRESCLPSVA